MKNSPCSFDQVVMKLPFLNFCFEKNSFHVLCIQIVSNQCKIIILHSALKTSQCLLGIDVEFVQTAPCRSLPCYKHTQAGKFNSQELSSASLLQTQL